MASDKVPEHAILNIVKCHSIKNGAGKFSCGVFVDLKKAFDTFDLGILLQNELIMDFGG